MGFVSIDVVREHCSGLLPMSKLECRRSAGGCLSWGLRLHDEYSTKGCDGDVRAPSYNESPVSNGSRFKLDLAPRMSRVHTDNSSRRFLDSRCPHIAIAQCPFNSDNLYSKHLRFTQLSIQKNAHVLFNGQQGLQTCHMKPAKHPSGSSVST